MKKYLFLAAFLLGFIHAGQVFAVNDSCLTLFCPNDGVSYNPDKVMIDTCTDSPTYGDWFQSGIWTIGFNKYIFKDSIKINRGKYLFLNDIDSINFPAYYSAFKTIEEQFGEITFHKDYSCSNYEDNSYLKAPCVYIFFNRRSRTKDVEFHLRRLPDIRFVRIKHFPFKSDIPGYCLSLYCPNDGESYNPDFICVDTCKDSPTFGDWYQSGTWTIGFRKFIFLDSLDKGAGAFLNDIDSIKFPEFYAAFSIIQEKFGFLTFHRALDVCNNDADYFFYKTPCLNVFFERRSRTKDIESYLWKLPDIKFVWMTNWPVKSDVFEQTKNDCYKIRQSTEDILLINLCDKTLAVNKISIFNVLGENLINLETQNQDIEIDINALKNAVYFIRINNKIFKILIIR